MDSFILTGNPIKEINLENEPQIASFTYPDMLYKGDNLGRNIVSTINKDFEGTPAAFSKSEIQDIANSGVIKYSNFYRAAIISKYLDENKITNLHLLGLKELIQYIQTNKIPELSSTYADIGEAVINPNSSSGENEEMRQRGLDIIGYQIKVPYLISGFGIKKVRKDTIEIYKSKSTKIEEAPYLRENGYLTYDSKTKKIIKSKDNKGIKVLVSSDLSGFRRVYRNWGLRVIAVDVNLADAISNGRVQVFYDPKGR